jgi:hypothetical protein
MAEAIVERPRHGSGGTGVVAKGYRKRVARQLADGGTPAREGIRRPYANRNRITGRPPTPSAGGCSDGGNSSGTPSPSNTSADRNPCTHNRLRFRSGLNRAASGFYPAGS